MKKARWVLSIGPFFFIEGSVAEGWGWGRVVGDVCDVFGGVGCGGLGPGALRCLRGGFLTGLD